MGRVEYWGLEGASLVGCWEAPGSRRENISSLAVTKCWRVGHIARVTAHRQSSLIHIITDFSVTFEICTASVAWA